MLKNENEMHSKIFTGEVWFFLTLTFVLSSVFYVLIPQVENSGWYHFGLMWCPGVAAIVTQIVFSKTLKGLGWKPNNGALLILSYLYPIIELSLVYCVIWGGGFGEFKGFEQNFITKLAPLAMILMILEGTYFSLRSALGEEIGWRGFLTPKLAEHYTPNTVSIIIGLIWSIWHFPLILVGDYGSNAPILFQLFCFTCMILGVNFVYTWFRLKEGSMWTGVLLHTSGNLFIFHVFDDLTRDTGNTAYFSGETGIVFAMFGLLLTAAFLWFGWDWPSKIKQKCRKTS